MNELDTALLERLKFRNGFLVHDTGLTLSGPAGWRRSEVGGLTIHIHPDTSLQVHGTGPEPRAIVFGEAFDPDEDLDPTALFAQLHRIFATRGRDALLDRLDDIMGRFVLMVEGRSGWEVFHDAIGSRSVFYHRHRGVLSSHTELIAETMSLRHDDFFIPFITSRNYINRDVKYLPGLATPYAELRQLSPNTSLSFPDMTVARYWPRRPVEAHADIERATDRLLKEMRGLEAFMRRSALRPVLGLTGGTDSRGLFSALHGLDPLLFTFVRSSEGHDRNSPDSKLARRIADAHGIDLRIYPIKSAKLNDAGNAVSHAFRRSTAYFRGIDSGWLHPILAEGLSYHDCVFVRGFGGEILRGFYRPTRTRIFRASPPQLANAYDVNAGSRITRSFFEEQIDLTDFSEDRLMGYDLNDMFYWEHRMGTWGSIAMSEADIATRSIVGYNSRRLYDVFLGLDYELRASRAASSRMVETLTPRIATFETI